MSLHNVDLGPRATTWNGFRNLDPPRPRRQVHRRLVLLVKYSAMCMIAEVLLGVLLAVILNGSRFEKILVTIFLMPMMMAPVIAGLVWYYLYNSTFGWYHWLMQSAGILGAKSILGSSRHRDVGHRHRRRLAVDAAHHADHAGRPEAGAARPARGEHGRRRRRDAQLLRRSPCPISTRSC